MSEDHEETTRPLATANVRHWSAADTETTFLVLGIKALMFLFAALSVGTLFDRYYGMMEMWNRWDAVHYLSLAEFGYVAEGERRFSIVFYPLYPWLVRSVSFFAGTYFVAALIVSGFASLGAALLLRRLSRVDHGAAVARQSAWFLLIFPTSYFLHIGYTESLFLALVLGSLLAARTNHWAAAGVLGALACLTRVNGLMLGPTLLMEAVLQYRASRRIDWRWLWIGVVPLGFLGYLALNYHVTGNAFAFSPIMEEHWFKKFTPPWVGIYDVWQRTPDSNLTEGLLELVFIILGLLGTVWCWIRLSPTYGIWMTLNWLLFNSTAFVVSVPRYTLTLFPLFILFARLAQKWPFAGRLLSVASLLLLALYVTKFAHGTWAF
ncbi:MAG: hypothetical protein ABI946_05865 [Chthoniobacterales bacterium]